MALHLLYLRGRWSRQGIWHCTCYIWEVDGLGKVYDIVLVILRGRWSRQGIWHCTCYIWEVDGLGMVCEIVLVIFEM